jgi:hypothetical protein
MDYKGQTKTQYTVDMAKKSSELASQPVHVEDVPAIDEAQKKRVRKPKEG